LRTIGDFEEFHFSGKENCVAFAGFGVLVAAAVIRDRERHCSAAGTKPRTTQRRDSLRVQLVLGWNGEHM
jgi:hypothetical protein